MKYDNNKYKQKIVRRNYKTKNGEEITKVYYYLQDRKTKKLTRYFDNYESRKSVIYATADGKKTKAYDKKIAEIKNDPELTASQKQQLISDFDDALGIARRKGVDFTDARWTSSQQQNSIARYLYNLGTNAAAEAKEIGVSEEDFLNLNRWKKVGDDYVFEWQGKYYGYEFDYHRGVRRYETTEPTDGEELIR